jgi:hypothetical protein
VHYDGAQRERCQNADSSARNRIVLVDQAAEEITPPAMGHKRWAEQMGPVTDDVYPRMFS